MHLSMEKMNEGQHKMVNVFVVNMVYNEFLSKRGSCVKYGGNISGFGLEVKQ